MIRERVNKSMWWSETQRGGSISQRSDQRVGQSANVVIREWISKTVGEWPEIVSVTSMRGLGNNEKAMG